MSVFKCKMCGGTLEVNPGETVGTCEYCGTKQTLPKANDEVIMNLFNRANNLRLKGEFDKASQIYEKIVQQDDSEAEAHWGIILCKYGVEYVEDPKTFERIPTCHRTCFESIKSDPDYQAVIDYSDTLQQTIYEKEARAIDKLQKDILAIVEKEEPFDVFICYKETDESGKRTIDSTLANDIYHQLTQNGLKVFYAAITLEDKLGQEYEPYIFAALNSAKVMLAIGTKPEYFNAVWVKNEWSRFMSFMKTDRSKILIPCYRDMDAYDLPEEFAHLQAQDMSKIGFIQDIIRGVEKVVGKDNSKRVQSQASANATGSNIDALLKRAFMFLEDGEWDRADDLCEQVLNQDPENAKAYLGKLMAELKVKVKSDLASCDTPFDSLNYYRKAVRFGDDKLTNELNGYINTINSRIENNKKQGIYDEAKAILHSNENQSEEEYKHAAQLFASISGFDDADMLAEKCIKTAESAKQKLTAVIEALLAGPNEGVQSTKERLNYFLQKKKILLTLINNYSDISNNIEEKKQLSRDTLSRIEILSNQRSKLGLFAGKEKKTIDNELAELEIKLESINIEVEQLTAKLQGYTSEIQVEKELECVSKDIEAFEEKLKAEQDERFKKYSYKQALEICKSDSDIEKKASSYIKSINARIDPYLAILFANPGDIISFGTYPNSYNHINKKEPIKWKVLTKEKNRMLLLSNYALDCQKYDKKMSAIWEKCSLRDWLNDTFLNDAFSPSEQSKILDTRVIADKNPEYFISPGNDTDDKVFLLSIREANTYFHSDSERKCQGTEFFYSKAASKNVDRHCEWWLRTPGMNSYTAAVVDGDNGKIWNSGTAVDIVRNGFGAVRPALWISLD